MEENKDLSKVVEELESKNKNLEEQLIEYHKVNDNLMKENEELRIQLSKALTIVNRVRTNFGTTLGFVDDAYNSLIDELNNKIK